MSSQTAILPHIAALLKYVPIHSNRYIDRPPNRRMTKASRQRLDKLLARRLNEHAFCAMLVDGTPFGDQQLITVIGLTVHGHKLVLGLRQGTTENTTLVQQLLDDLGERGVDFDAPHQPGEHQPDRIGFLGGGDGTAQREALARRRQEIGPDMWLLTGNPVTLFRFCRWTGLAG